MKKGDNTQDNEKQHTCDSPPDFGGRALQTVAAVRRLRGRAGNRRENNGRRAGPFSGERRPAAHVCIKQITIDGPRDKQEDRQDREQPRLSTARRPNAATRRLSRLRPHRPGSASLDRLLKACSSLLLSAVERQVGLQGLLYRVREWKHGHSTCADTAFRADNAVFRRGFLPAFFNLLPDQLDSIIIRRSHNTDCSAA